MNAIILDNKKGNASSSSKSFGGVRYNTNKMDKGKGELMALRNFGEIKNDTLISPEEVKQYLLAIAKKNPRKKKVQFHAAISCKGKEYDKHQLTDAAHDWVKKMGYGDNPYIVVFHSDTDNNHVHIVSTRVNALTGKSISDSMENVKAVKYIDQIVKEKYGIDRKLSNEDFSKYNVTTLAQFKLLYEVTGHSVSETNGKLNIMKDGSLLASHDISTLLQGIGKCKEDENRKKQLKAILSKYLPDFEATLKPIHQKLSGNRNGKIIGYKSDLTDFIRERFGLQFVFHFSGNKPPYGYTIIDHKSKSVFKGGGLMKLSELTKSADHKVKLSSFDKKLHELKGYNIDNLDQIKILARKFNIPEYRIPPSDRSITKEEKAYYKDLLTFYLKNNDISTLENINMEIVSQNDKWYILDNGAKTILDADEILSMEHIEALTQDGDLEQNQQAPDFSVLNPIDGLAGLAGSITPDSDDDSKRKRKKRKM